MRQRIEPPSTGIVFPDPRRAGRREILAIGSDFRPGTLLTAYRAGIFPWPHHDEAGNEIVAWFSPNPRAVFLLDKAPHWSRSLRRELRAHTYRITIDTAFREVVIACGERRETGTWITPDVILGYTRLHELGWAHSLEVWDKDELVGGIYGVAVGGEFAAESMFHRRTNASKVAFATLAERLRAAGYILFDAEVMNPHLLSLGCVDIQRPAFLGILERALLLDPQPLTG